MPSGRDGELVCVEIASDKGGAPTLVYGDQRRSLALKAGQRVTLDGRLNPCDGGTAGD